jgi:hypothetical protein
VLEALVPTPRHLVASPAHHEDRQPHEIKVEKVQVVRLMLYPCQQHTSGLPDLHHASVDVDLVADLIKLPNAHDVGCHSRDEVLPFERSTLNVLAHEHYSPTALDLCHRNTQC